MAPGNLQLNWLRTFEAAGRHLSFSLAAEELHLSQSAVSQQIKLLEQRLGKALFKRQIRSVRLTTEGRAYLDVVRDGIARLNTGTTSIFGSPDEQILALSVNNSFAELWLAPRLNDFIAQHPQLSIQLLQTNWDLDYAAANTELQIRYGDGRWPGRSATKILPQRLRPYCAPKLTRTLSTLEGFVQVPLIDVLGTPNGWRDWKQIHAPATVNHSNRFSVDSYAVAVSMAIEGIGACLLYDGFVKHTQLESRLQSPIDAALDCESSYYLTSLTDRPLSGPGLAFSEWLIAKSEKIT